ncbi:hypothetical protein Ppa06_17940 [Planomonospora parontospora subsp. parontospora]|uniref:Uncharacterized protein n=2 Tax=Planomonospora parontospora TaxID=58119 RepID=A0AA37F3L8_9ACTN|nr:hypothetical protein [Planomonospora parontospora]GGK59201.1 hypothetical protein GCM10010126_18510 [Planomonospora parontospora]GII07996.1 hypothetical protein Ppa06_17940 [Planomonospora parontospora subsp. parontospora]
MALIVLAADKGAPGVTTAATALGAVWPRPVLLAECDPAGGDVAYRLPAADGGVLNPGRGLLTLGATARRGLTTALIHEHTQKIVGGLDVLAGLTHGEQAAGLTWLWGPLGRALAALPGADVLADCGRLGGHPELGELIAEAGLVVLFTRGSLDHVAHLRERLHVMPRGARVGVVVIADPRQYRGTIEDVRRIVAATSKDVAFVAGLAHDPKGAELLRGQWGGRLDRSLLIRTARELAGRLAAETAPREAPGAVRGTVPSTAPGALPGTGLGVRIPRTAPGPYGEAPAPNGTPAPYPAPTGWREEGP